MRRRKHKLLKIIMVLVILAALFSGNSFLKNSINKTQNAFENAKKSVFEQARELAEGFVVSKSGGETAQGESYNKTDIPDYDGNAYVVINSNKPEFSDLEYSESSYEYYGALDELGRCTVCISCIGKDIMPTEERGDISEVYPTGWDQHYYESIEDGFIYNRCHLLGYQLTAENDNVNNLITGTRYFNTEGMEPFENMVASYIRRTGNHVMYKVEPVFTGNNLVCDGVFMEGLSVEDNGKGISFSVFCYNVQPGFSIDYKTGKTYEN